MSIIKDIQSKFLTITETVALTQTSEGASYYVLGTTAIDMKDVVGVAVSVSSSRVLTTNDSIYYTPVDGATTSPTTEIDEDKLLPDYAISGSDLGIALGIPTSPYNNTFGFTGANRYVKHRFNGVAIDTTDITFTVTTVLEMAIQPAGGAGQLPTSDGLP